MKRLPCLLLLLLSAQAAPAEVYRCSANGRTVYQDRPCPGQSREASRAQLPPISIVPSTQTEPAAATPDTATDKPTPAPAATGPARPSLADIRAAILGNRVLVGMTGEEALAAAGRHTDHHTESGRDVEGDFELWTFSARLDSYPTVLRLRGGVVTETRGR